MAKKKKKVPGTIYTKKNRNVLYIGLKGKEYSTGIVDDPEGKGRLACQAILEKMWAEMISTGGHIPETVRIKKAVEEKQEVPQVMLNEKFDEFMNLKERQGKSKNTLLHYRLAKKRIIGVDKNGKNNDIPLTIEEIDKVIRNFIELRGLSSDGTRSVNGKNEEALSNNSINIYLREFNCFISHCVKKGHLPRFDINEYKLKGTQKEKEAFEANDWNIILKTIDRVINERLQDKQYARKNQFRSVIDREFQLMLQFMYLCGSRRTETLRLKWDNINFKKGYIIFPNKNTGEAEKFPITSNINEILLELKEIADQRKVPSKREKVFRWEETSTSRLHQAYSFIEKEAGTKIPKNAFHKLRKSFVNKIMDSDMPIQQIHELNRHRDMRTTYESYRTKNIELAKSSLEAVESGKQRSNEYILLETLKNTHPELNVSLLLTKLVSMNKVEINKLLR